MDYAWRILLVVSYGVALGVVGETWKSEAAAIALWALAPAVGFVVRRWWVILAVPALMIFFAATGAESYDMEPAPWYAITSIYMLLLIGMPLLAGVGAFRLWSRYRTGSWTPPGRHAGRWRRFVWTREVPPT